MVDNSQYSIGIDLDVQTARAERQVRDLQEVIDRYARSGEIAERATEDLTRATGRLGQSLQRATKSAVGDFGRLGGELRQLQTQMNNLSGLRGSNITSPLNSGFVGQLNGSYAEQANQAAAANKQLESSLERTTAAYRALDTAQQNSAPEMSEQARAANRLSAAQEELARAQRKVDAAGKTRDPRQVASALDQERTAVGRVARATDDLAAAQRRAVQSTEQLQGELASLRYLNYDIAQTSFFAAGASAAGLVVPTTFFAQWESGMTGVERTTGAAGQQLEVLEGQLEGLSRTIPVTSQEILDMAARAGQLGIAQEDVAQFTETLSQFVAISDTLDATEAAEYIARIGNLTGTSDWEALASAIALVGVNSAATDQQIVDTAEEIAQAGALANLTAQDVVGLSGALASMAVPPERARSVLFSLFTEVNRGIAGLSDSLPQYAQLLGLTVDETVSLYETDPTQFITRLAAALGATENMTAALDALGLDGARAQPVFAALSQNIPLLTSALDDANQGFAESNEVSRQFGLVQDDLASKWQVFLNNIQLTAAELGEHFAPAIGDALTAVAEFAANLSAFIQSPVGEQVAIWGGRVLALVTAFAVLRGAMALTTAGIVAFTQVNVGTSLIGSITGVSQLRNAFAGLNSAMFTSRGAASGAAIGFETVARSSNHAAGALNTATASTGRFRAALLALGRATLIIGLLVALTEVIFNFNGALMVARDQVIFGNTVMATFAQFLLYAGSSAATAAGKFFALFAPLQGIANFAFAAAREMQRLLEIIGIALPSVNAQIANAFPKEMKQASTAVQDTSSAFESAIPYFEEGSTSIGDFGDEASGAGDSASGAADGVDDLTEAVRTLVDYASDLEGVFSRAFDLRFANQLAADGPALTYIEMAEAIDEAARRMRDLRQEIRGLRADIGSNEAALNTQRYFLSIATEYDDDLRAGEIRAKIAELEAEIAGQRNDLSDKTNELSKEEAAASKALTGNTKAAIQNRQAITDLVKQYQAQLTALASSGASQEEQARVARRLKSEFLAQATALGYSESELQQYAKAFDDFGTIIAAIDPRVTVDFNADPALQALAEFQARLNEANRSMEQLNSGGGSGGGGGGSGGGGIPGFGLPSEEEFLGRAANMAERLIPTMKRPLERAGRVGAIALRRGLDEGYRRGDSEETFGLTAEEFRRAMEANLNLGGIITGQSPFMIAAMRNTGKQSQTGFKQSFTNGLALNDTISRVGAQAAPAMSDGGRAAGTYFRGGFSSNADISGIISREGNKGAPGMKQPGVLAGAYYRDGFNTNSSVADIVAKSARNANTQEYVNLGRSAGENFKQGFRSNGTLDVALDLPNGMKAAQGGIGKLRFYSGGGYTGAGGKYEAAGIVHKGEYVIPKKDVNQSTGMPYADALGRLQRGSKASGSYAQGGYVGAGLGNGPIELGDRTVMKVARAVQHITVVGDERVANAAGRGNAAMQRRGGN